MGSHVLRREAVLGHDQSGCMYFVLLYTVYSDYTSFKKVSVNYNPHNRRRVFLLLHLNGSIQSAVLAETGDRSPRTFAAAALELSLYFPSPTG